MAIRVESPGLLTTVQDAGRPGKYNIVLPPSGAMDLLSYEVGNYLVGNEPDAAGLEITYFGPRLQFTEDAVIALTGAEMPPRINGDEVATWEALRVRAGDVLSFDYLKAGARSYLAIAGGIDVPASFGSRSTYTYIGIGGYEGRALQEGDELHVGESRNGAGHVGTAVAPDQIPAFSDESELRVIIGLCSYLLTGESKEEFLGTEWTVTPDADRTGYRYRGGVLSFREREQPSGAGSGPGNVVDINYPMGSIQVPGGEPIVLARDAITGGGFATIGTVITADLDRLAQTKTNDKTHFRSVTLDEALQARMRRQRRLEEIKSTLGA